MRTEQIYYLMVVNKHASINAAAEELKISPQALSLSMKTLEDELGMSLLNRTRSGSFLTEQGIQLLSHGMTFLDAIENMKNTRDAKYPALSNATIKLEVTNGALETSFSSAISQLYIDYPNCKLSTERLKYSDIIDRHSLKSSLGIVYLLSMNDTPINTFDDTTYEFISFMTGNYYCIAHPKFPVSNYKTVSLRTMSSYPNIIYAPAKDIIMKLFDTKNLNHKNYIIVDDYSVYKQMLLTGAGLGLYYASEKNISKVSSALNLIPLKEKVVSSIGCIKLKKRKLSTAEQEFVNYMCDYYQNIYFNKPIIF